MRKELIDVRNAMKNQGVNWLIVPTNDFHGSEFINEYFKTRQYISGFTGSAGTLVVGEEGAWLWTDGRYFLQAGQQLKDTGIDLMKMGEPGVPTTEEFLYSKVNSGETIAFDGRVVNAADGFAFEKLAEEKQGKVVYNLDIPGEVWTDRPELKGKKVVNYPLSYAGTASEKKLEKIRYVLRENGFDYHLIPGLEENAWLFNLRGKDVEYTPTFFSFSLVTPTVTYLYGFKDAFSGVELPESVVLRDYFQVFEDMKKIPEGATVLSPLTVCSYSLIKMLKDGVVVKNGISPVTTYKALKNSVEISSTKHAHIEDGVSMINFMYWLDMEPKENHTELTVSNKLEEFRSENPDFRGLSFETIAGYGENGAIIHYAPTAESQKQLKPEGFLLLDSGGQYLNGTTDITRTLVLGDLTDKMKKYYTAVLKAHIALSSAVFEPGTTGKELDDITRKPLRDIGLDYNHGTGHGVGHYLSVHEGPQNIGKKRGDYPIYANMVTTDEPGVYTENEFGVRLENELLSVKHGDAMLAFEPITLVPFDRRAIVAEDLTKDELDWLNRYHQRVYETIGPRLEKNQEKWLKEMTAKITV